MEVTCGRPHGETIGGAEAGVNISHFVEGEHCGKRRESDCQHHLKKIGKSSNQLNGVC